MIGVWIVLQVWEGLGSFGRPSRSGGVAYLAHVGGAATGLIVGLDLLRPRPSTSTR